MYLAAITICLCISYFVINPLFALFFKTDCTPNFLRTFKSIAFICVASFLSYLVSFQITDIVLENRVLHALGGGFLGVFVCFLVVKDSKMLITRMQFIVLSILVATLLGVANELAECILQNYTSMIFAETINDTWLDLVSNTVGILTGILAFTPFIGRRK